MRMMPEGCWECVRTEFFVALLKQPAIVVACVAQVLHEPLVSRIASVSESAGCCEHLVTSEYILLTNLAVSDNFGA